MTSGLCVRALVSLIDESDSTRAWAALASGSKSLMFQFSDRGVIEDTSWFGAVMTTSHAVPLMWGDVRREVMLYFWDEAVLSFVHEGAEFNIWYSRTIGGGMVVEVVDQVECQ